MAPVVMPATARSKEEKDALIEKMTPGLRHLLGRRFELQPEWMAELSAEGYTCEEMVVPMGSSREEIIETMKVTLELDWDHKEGRKVGMKILAAHAVCKEKAGSEERQRASAAALGNVHPMDGTVAKEAFEKLKEDYPGLLLDKQDRPTEHYMGVLEEMARTDEWTGETLKQVVARKEKGYLKRDLLSGENSTLTIGLCNELELPAHVGSLKKRYTTMGIAWVSLSKRHQNLQWMVGLRLETFQAFSAYVMGPEVLGMAKNLGKDTWKLILDAEMDVRCAWHEAVAEKGISLNLAILESIGATADKHRSGIWQRLANELIASQGGGNKRQAQQEWQWGRNTLDNSDQKGGDKSKGGGKNKSKKGGKKEYWKNSGKGLGDKSGQAVAPTAPKEFHSKLTSCLSHQKRICYDFHLSGCKKGAACKFCHECCPEPGCRQRCGANHGLWSH